jgi:hypothetical protein
VLEVRHDYSLYSLYGQKRLLRKFDVCLPLQ